MTQIEKLRQYEQRHSTLSEKVVQQRLANLKTWYRIGEYEDMEFTPETKMAATLIAQGKITSQEAVNIAIQKYKNS